MSKYGVFSRPYFPVFAMNTEIYSVNLRIQSEYGKIRAKKNSVFGHFSLNKNYILFSLTCGLANFLYLRKQKLSFRNF